ncbi:MAG TPA: hypothetical protein VK488_11945 [Gaiellaceae bacterium]|nr:hypothetical protein [Gaiellaceae bacterium]
MPTRLTVAGVLALLALTVGVQSAAAAASPKAPKALKAFLLRVNEPESLYNRNFPRTPAFAWNPVAGAKTYEFELSTSENFSESAVVWSSSTSGVTLKSPAATVPISLPWMTGNPYALYARVRGITPKGRDGRWSKPYGFNTRWRDRPRPLDPQFPGLVRWTPIEGATMYEVWFQGSALTFLTTTNVADEREFYAFHTQPWWIQSVNWRIRAVRKLYGEIPTGMPRVTYGAWSDWFTNFNPPFNTDFNSPYSQTPAEIALSGTVSGDVVSTPAAPRAHELLPAFMWTGNYRSWGQPWFLDTSTELFHVYVYTDSECVNRVYTSAIVGGPAYAPRLGQTLAYPGTFADLNADRNTMLTYGPEGPTLMLDGTVVTAADASSTGNDLWDTFWPSGGYYWTVVPIFARPDPLDGTKIIDYRDIQLPEDVCRAGGSARFGKVSKPVVVGDKAPYASGLSPTGSKLLPATKAVPSFYGQPLVAWEPVAAAQEYEIQWSRTLNPWRTQPGSLKSGATSAVLPLTPGRWYYRVRGLNPLLPGKPEMTWSKPVALKIAKPRFKIVRP